MEPSGVIDSGGAVLIGPPARRRWLPPLATVILLSACGPSAPPAGTPTPGLSAPSPGATSASSPTPATPTDAPGPFRIVADAPVIPREIVPGRAAILPGAIAEDDGTFHAWVVAFDEAPGTQDIHHLTSVDAIAWTEVADSSLEPLSDGLGNPGALPTSIVREGEGWVMYFTGTLASERQAWEVWRATAANPNGPWTRGEAPVLRRGPAGSWDSGGLDFPTVLPVDDGWLLLYSGQNPTHPEAGSIGRATSPDGLTWTKHDDPATTEAPFAESDPVVQPGLCGAFDARAVHQARLVVDGGRLVMAYAGWGNQDQRSRIGLAASDDLGVTWSCRWPTPALDTGGLPSGFVHTLTAFRRGERLALLVEWFARDGTDVWLVEAETLP